MNIKAGFAVLFFSLNLFGAGYDLYEPETAKAAKTVVFVHGGAWIGGDKSQYKAVGEAFAKAGFCAVVADYSLAPKAMHPQPVRDLNLILNKFESRKSKCDSKKIYLIGHSAGAHMIGFLASLYVRPSVKGFVGLEGIYDIPNIAKAFPDYPDWFIKAEFGDEKNWAAASPAQLEFKSKAPWLVVHSKLDELVDSKQASDFKLHLDSQKIKNEVVWLEKEKHFDTVKTLQDPNSELFKRVQKFIDEN